MRIREDSLRRKDMIRALRKEWSESVGSESVAGSVDVVVVGRDFEASRVARILAGVMEMSRSNGSKTRVVSRLYISRPSVEQAQKERPVGAKATAVTRTSGRVVRAAASPRRTPGKVRSIRSSRSEASPVSSIRPRGPPSVRSRLFRNS